MSTNTKQTNKITNTKKPTGIAIFSAVIILLQLFATFVKFGPFEITLVLAPIVVGAAVYGAAAGAFLGGVFGAVVLMACIFGWSLSGNVLWMANPPLTALLCIAKGAAAGFLSGAVYNLLASKKSNIGVIAAAITCPVVNTGIFCAAFALFYSDVLKEWAAGTSTLSFIFVSIIGINFVLEFAINVILSPIISRVLIIRKIMK